MRTIKLGINDFYVCVKTKHKIICDCIQDTFKRFVLNSRHICGFTVIADFLYRDWTKTEQSKLIITREKNIYKICFRSFEAYIHWKERKAILKASPDLSSLQFSMENFLRALYALYLLENNGFLLHSASSIYKKKAYVFFGKSGSGKTTLSNLLKNKMEIISDDLSVVMLFKNKFIIRASPFRLWDGKLKNRSFPIAGIFAIRKAKTFSIRHMNFRDTLRLLISCAPFLPESNKICEQTIIKIEKLAMMIPCFELRFPKKNTVARKLISTIKKSKGAI